MIPRTLVEAHRDVLALRESDGKFFKEAWHLVGTLKDDVYSSLGTASQEIVDRKTFDAQGILGVSCALRHNDAEQHISFGICHDPSTQKIKFIIEHEPEFIVLFTYNPKYRELLLSKLSRDVPAAALRDHGYSVNFPDDKLGNPWILCCWHEPMKKFDGVSVENLCAMFSSKLAPLLNSEYFRIVSDLAIPNHNSK
ncbi:MAG: hypothetical protein ACREEI_01935 [Stellaceae bacterium]